MADLDYAKVTGRFGLSIGDTTSDPDLDPDLVWCTEGRVLLTPLNTFVKVPAGHPMPFTMGNAVYEAQISGPEYVDPTGGGNDGAGHLVFNGPFGQPFVNVVDLTSPKVNPKIGSDSATHRVTFVGVKAAMPGTGVKVDVSFPSFTARITAAGAAGDGVNDLTLLAPVLPGELQPIYQGPAGVSVNTTTINTAGDLVFTMTDGSTRSAALSTSYAQVVTPVAGETAAAATTRVNAALAASNAFGTRRSVRLVGDFTFNGPLVVLSNTALDTTSATITLASNSNTNGLINQAVQTTRRVMDAVTTASSTTVTSATAAFVAGDVGKTFTVWNPAATGGKFVTTIASVTNGTTAVLAAAPTVTGSAQYASIGGRDTNITVRLGKVVRSAGNYVSPANGWLSNHIRFRHVDNLHIAEIHDISIASGKYAVNVGDCTRVRVGRIYASSTASDVLHINGPCAGVTVDEVVSDGSGDDIVSLTGGDFTTVHQMADCQGDITDVHIGTIVTKPSTHVPPYTRALLILGGQSANQAIQYGCKRITVDRIDSQLEAFPVFVGPDVQDNNTQGGYYEDLNLCANGGTNRVASGITPPLAMVGLRSGSMVRVQVGPVRNVGGTSDLLLDAGAVVTDLTVSGVRRSRIRTLSTTPPAQVRILGDRAYGSADTTAIQTSDRRFYDINNVVTLTSGTVIFTYFRPDETVTLTSVATYTRGNAAAGTTLARYGIYEVGTSPADDLTLIASTANDATMWNSTFAGVGRALSANVTLSPFKVYALGVLFVGTTAPKIVGVESFSGSALKGGSERLATSLSGQTDLPALAGWASLQTTEGKFVYANMATV